MRRLLCVCVAGLASSLEAQSGPGPCPSEDAGIQIVLQAENVGQSPEPLSGVIRPLDETKPTPIVARTDPLEIHVGIASKLGAESGGVQGWLISARFLGDIEFVDASTGGTVAGDEAGGPPGIRKDGFERTEFLVPPYEGIPGIESSVVLSLSEPVTLLPRGTATVLRLRLRGPFGSTGLLQWVQGGLGGDGSGTAAPSRDGSGAGGYFTPSSATVGGDSLAFSCHQDARISFLAGEPDFSACCVYDPDAVPPPAVEWEERYGEGQDHLSVASVVRSESGYAIAGTTTKSGRWDAFLLRLDSQGRVEGESLYARADASHANHLTALPDGFLLVGSANTHASTVEGVEPTRNDVLLIRTDLEGEVVWEKTLPHAGEDRASAAVVLEDGEFAVAGEVEFPDGTGQAVISKGLVIRLAADGSVLWEKTYGEGSARAYGIAALADGGVAIGGSHWDETVGSTAWLLGLDAAGVPIWERKFQLGEASQIQSLTTAPNGDLAIAGSLWNYPPSGSIEQLHAARIAPNGIALWQDIFERPATGAESIRALEGGGFVVAGTTIEEGVRAYLLEFDDDGRPLREAFVGEPGTGVEKDVDVETTAGGAYVLGFTYRNPSASGQSLLAVARLSTATGQVPGDCNQDGRVDLSDGICCLGFLFLHMPDRLPCGSGEGSDPGNLLLLDINSDGRLDLSDPVRLFGYLFLGTAAPERGSECVATPGCVGICAPAS